MMNLFNPLKKEQSELFTDKVFLGECTKTIKAIGTIVPSLNDIENMIPSLIDLGESFLEKGVLLKDYAVVLKAM